MADYSQVELRVLANMSGDEALIRVFAEGGDIHAQTARFLFAEAETITSDMRRAAKSVNFGVVYGITPFGLSKMLGTSASEAGRYIDAFFARYPRVREYYDTVLADVRARGYAETYFGRRRYIPTISDANRMVRERSEREAINAPIQGTAADIIKLAMVAVEDRFRAEGLYSRMLLSVHDELVFEVHPDEDDRVRECVRSCMEGVMSGAVTLRVDIGMGANWSAAKK